MGTKIHCSVFCIYSLLHKSIFLLKYHLILFALQKNGVHRKRPYKTCDRSSALCFRYLTCLLDRRISNNRCFELINIKCFLNLLTNDSINSQVVIFLELFKSRLCFLSIYSICYATIITQFIQCFLNCFYRFLFATI